MNVEELTSLFEENFPFWNDLSPIDKETMCRTAHQIQFKKGMNIHDGNECTGVILVKTGSLRLYMLSEDGKEITLYRIFPGEMCMLSASCVLQTVTFDVFVDAEEDCECYVVDGGAYSSVAENNPNIKIFALETAISRFSDVMWVMQQILFMSIDKRLAIFLIDESTRIGSDRIELTHEQIAKYIGSAREVVSRMLKYFTNEGIVESSRKGVLILDKKRLRALTL